jgi:hypothetical protein
MGYSEVQGHIPLEDSSQNPGREPSSPHLSPLYPLFLRAYSDTRSISQVVLPLIPGITLFDTRGTSPAPRFTPGLQDYTESRSIASQPRWKYQKFLTITFQEAVQQSPKRAFRPSESRGVTLTAPPARCSAECRETKYPIRFRLSTRIHAFTQLPAPPDTLRTHFRHMHKMA